MRILAADYEQQQRLENKLWFDRFLARHEIPRPESSANCECTTPRFARIADTGLSAPKTAEEVDLERFELIDMTGPLLPFDRRPDRRHLEDLPDESPGPWTGHKQQAARLVGPRNS